MDVLIWIGAALTLFGVAGLLTCVARVRRAKNANLSEAEMKEQLQKVVALNVGAFCLSALGLMLVVVGILLG